MNWVINLKLNVLLVDDEYPILNNLSKVLNWADMGTQVAGMARSGAEALQMMEEQKIDIILSDIRMPVMDGLTLVKEIRDRGYEAEVVLLSGYQEFEYARTAIRYGVKDYINKPIHYEMLQQIVQRVADQIRSERANLERSEQLVPVIQWANEHFLSQLLAGHGFLGEVDSEEDEFLVSQRYAVVLVDLEGYARASVLWEAKLRLELNRRIKKLLRNVFPASSGLNVLQLREGEWFVFFDHAQGLDRPALYPVFRQVQDLVEQCGGNMLVRMSAYPGPYSLKELPSVYRHAQRALLVMPANEWLLNGNWSRDHHADLSPGKNETEWAWTERIGRALHGSEDESIEEVIADLRRYIAGLDESSTLRAEKLLNYMLIHLLRELRELRQVSHHEEEAVWGRLQQPLGLKDLMELLENLADRPKEPTASRKSAEQLMAKAGDYIQKQLGSTLGIEEVADHLGISCSYFCLLFKNYYGETFVEHLTRQRMEAAKRLLQNSDTSITQIGQLLGYQERRYFTKVFQKFTGRTPSEFRAMSGGGSAG